MKRTIAMTGLVFSLILAGDASAMGAAFNRPEQQEKPAVSSPVPQAHEGKDRPQPQETNEDEGRTPPSGGEAETSKFLFFLGTINSK